jgi:hypothetical protein
MKVFHRIEITVTLSRDGEQLVFHSRPAERFMQPHGL